MTPEQIDRVLPRAATWPPKLYDLTDTDERHQACEWLAGLCSQATETAPESPESDEDPMSLPVAPRNGRTAHRGTIGPWELLGVWRSNISPLYDTPVWRGTGELGAMEPSAVWEPAIPKQDWPPPAKGTHESDLDFMYPEEIYPTGHGSFRAARAWSRSA
jgi:hypothetical protein